jgi:hypothetical protein
MKKIMKNDNKQRDKKESTKHLKRVAQYQAQNLSQVFVNDSTVRNLDEEVKQPAKPKKTVTIPKNSEKPVVKEANGVSTHDIKNASDEANKKKRSKKKVQEAKGESSTDSSGSDSTSV